MENQPIVNIGMLGSVSDGKSTTVYSLTGIKTQRHSNELKRNITIKPGYANLKIYKTTENNTSYYSNNNGELVHHISFIDCPGHYQLIVTMMSCIKLMDGIILVVSAAEPLDSKPQLIQHIMAIKMSGLRNIIVLLNKLDLVKKPIAQKRFCELVELLKKYDIEPKVIIPVCMNHGIGVELVLENIMKYMGPDISNKLSYNPLFLVSRSFDINKVNTEYTGIEGGVLGGSLISGKFKIGDTIEIRPGIIGRKPDGTLSHKPHITVINSLKSETTELQIINPGGLIGIGTDIDPYYCKNDNMIGNVIGLKGYLPEVYYDITIKYDRVNFGDNEWYPYKHMSMIVIVGTNSLDGKIIDFNNEYISLNLSKPVCIDKTDMIILCSKNNSKSNCDESFSIVSYGHINDYVFTKPIDIPTNNNYAHTDNHSTDGDSSDIDIDDI
jgi:translation initiation factor 2 subunit 3